MDTRRLEHGGLFSPDTYKINNNGQTDILHQSHLGAPVYDNFISCITMTDDVVLVSTSRLDLRNPLQLTNMYCAKNDLELVASKRVP